MDKNEFSSYRKLNPDGYIGFSIVDMEEDEDVQDVVVTFHRRKNLSTEKQLPFAVCRMNIYDLFTNAIKPEKDKDVTYLGCSVSQDSCPADIEFPTLLAYDDIRSMILTACYIEDTIDDILKLESTQI